MQAFLDKSTICNEKQGNKQFQPKFGKIDLQKYTLFYFLSTIYNFFGPKYHLQSTCFNPLWSTIYNENNGQIYNLQFDLTNGSQPKIKMKMYDDLNFFLKKNGRRLQSK